MKLTYKKKVFVGYVTNWNTEAHSQTGTPEAHLYNKYLLVM